MSNQLNLRTFIDAETPFARAKALADLGLSPLPIPKGKMRPKGKWSEYEFQAGKSEADFIEGIEVGIRLDGSSLVDVDIDWLEGREIMADLFPLAPTFGRSGKEGTHLFVAADLDKTIKFQLPNTAADAPGIPDEHALCVLELRSKGLIKPPPGLHHKDGKTLAWNNNATLVPAESNDWLIKQAGLAAFLTVCARFYPGEGCRHDFGVQLSGALARICEDASEIDSMVQLVAETAGDEEAAQRGAGKSSLEKLEAGKDVTGMPAVVKSLGLPDDCSPVFNGWLGFSQILPEPSNKVPMNTARRFLIDHHMAGETITLRYHAGSYYRYKDEAYVVIEPDYLSKDVYGYCDRFFPVKKYDVANVLDIMRGLCLLPEGSQPPIWLTDTNDRPDPSDIVAFKNGLLDLGTGVLLPPNPEFFTTSTLAVNYDADAGLPPRWSEFLQSTFAGDEDQVEHLRQVMGYIISGDMSREAVFVFYGPPRSGKSTTISVLEAILGALNTASSSLADLDYTFGLQGFVGKVLLSITDVRIDPHTSKAGVLSAILAISGQDEVTVQIKYGNAWKGRLGVRILIATNELIRLNDHTKALAARLVPVIFPNSFTGKADTGLKRALQKELASIAKWAIDGYMAEREATSFSLPPSSEAYVSDLDEVNNNLLEFVETCCALGDEYDTKKDDLYHEYSEWCQEVSVFALGKQAFSQRLLSLLPSVRSDRIQKDHVRVRVYRGITTTTDKLLSGGKEP